MRDTLKEREIWQVRLGERIRELRLKRGLTAGDLAILIRVGRRAIVYWEGGEQTPALDKIAQIAEAVDCPLSVLISVLDDLPAPTPHQRAPRRVQLERAARARAEQREARTHAARADARDTARTAARHESVP